MDGWEVFVAALPAFLAPGAIDPVRSATAPWTYRAFFLPGENLLGVSGKTQQVVIEPFLEKYQQKGFDNAVRRYRALGSDFQDPGGLSLPESDKEGGCMGSGSGGKRAFKERVFIAGRDENQRVFPDDDPAAGSAGIGLARADGNETVSERRSVERQC